MSHEPLIQELQKHARDCDPLISHEAAWCHGFMRAADALEQAEASLAVLRESLEWETALKKALLPYQDRAVKAEQEVEALRMELDTEIAHHKVCSGGQQLLLDMLSTKARRADASEQEVAALRTELDTARVEVEMLRDVGCEHESRPLAPQTIEAWQGVINVLNTEVAALRQALQQLHKEADSYVKLSRTQGESLRPEAADRVRNTLAVARELLASASPEPPGAPQEPPQE